MQNPAFGNRVNIRIQLLNESKPVLEKGRNESFKRTDSLSLSKDGYVDGCARDQRMGDRDVFVLVV